MENNNKRKIVIGSAVGVILLLLIIVSVAFSKGNNDNVEVASITEETEEPETEEVETEEVETPEPETEESETEEPETEEPETEEVEAEEPETEEADTEDSGTEEVDKEEVSTEPTVVPTTAPATTTTTSNSWGTPQEYHGDPEGKGPGRIIVKGFDYNDFFDGYSWKGEYWTASNGVEIKIVSVTDYTGGTGRVPVPDGKGKDNEPNSPYQIAMAEAAGDNVNKFNADLNVTLPLATYKRAEIDINDANIVAYRNAYDYKLYSINGQSDLYKPYQYGDPVNQRLAMASDGVAEFDKVGGKFWHIRRVNDYWEVRINGNLAEFRWDGIHQVLRYLSPDGDSLYQLIYEDFYTGRQDIMPEYDEWYSYQNSQVMIHDTEQGGYVIYYFK